MYGERAAFPGLAEARRKNNSDNDNIYNDDHDNDNIYNDNIYNDNDNIYNDITGTQDNDDNELR